MDRVISRSNTILIPGFILAALVVWLALPQGATFGSVASNVFPDSGNPSIRILFLHKDHCFWGYGSSKERLACGRIDGDS